MLSAKKVLTIRISGRERKEKVRKLLYDLAHFRNILIILIRRYELVYKELILNQSILYGLLSAKEYSGKYREEFERVVNNIQTEQELREFLDRLKVQKEKIENPHFVQSVIRQVIKDFKVFSKPCRALGKILKDSRAFPNLQNPRS